MNRRLVKFFDIFPGLKTYASLITIFGMLICQGGGFHAFSGEAWGAAVTAVLTFWKLGQDRKAE